MAAILSRMWCDDVIRSDDVMWCGVMWYDMWCDDVMWCKGIGIYQRQRNVNTIVTSWKLLILFCMVGIRSQVYFLYE